MFCENPFSYLRLRSEWGHARWATWWGSTRGTILECDIKTLDVSVMAHDCAGSPPSGVGTGAGD